MSRARLRALGTALPGRAPRTLIVSVAVLAMAAASLAVAPSAQAGEIESRHHGEEVRIEARYRSALQGIDPLVFDVTRSEASVDDLDVRVTVSSGIVSARKLSYTVTIPAGEAEAVLSVPTGDPAPGAATGDVTATVEAASGYEVGDPSSASVRLHVGDPMVTVRFDQESYSVPEDTGSYTGIRLIARTAANVPAPKHPIQAAVFFESGTATSPEDYGAGLLLVSFGASGWAVDGDTYVSSSPVPLTPVDDSESEDDETLRVVLGAPPDLPGTVDFVAADGATCTDSCTAEVTILDDDSVTIIDSDHSGDATIAAAHPTALQGIDNLVFTVTRSSATEEELEVPVTLSPGIVAADRLSHTVTIPANETSAELTVRTGTLDPAAATGDVTATVGGGESHDVGDPSSATVRVYVGTKLVTVRFNAESYMLAEGGGAATGEIVLLARTEPGVPAPTGTFQIAVTTQAGTAVSPDDYGALSSMLSFPGSPPAAWIADGDAFWAEVRVPLTIVDDTEAEGDETLRLLQEMTPGLPLTVEFAPAEPEVQTCSSNRYCEAAVTIVDDDNRSVVVSQAELTVDEGDTTAYTVVLTQEPTDDVTVTPEVQGAKNADITVSGPLTFTRQDWDTPQTVTVTAAADSNRANGSAAIAHPVAGGDYEANGVNAPPVEVTEWDAEGRTVVTLVPVPDGTVIPDNSTLTVGETVTDGSTFLEDQRVLYRLLFAAADGGRAQYGADVELTFSWKHNSPIVPTSGQVSRIVLSLYRVDVWDSAVQILDNDVGNPDSTVVVRITGCERNGCVIGSPSELTVTIADDDGGPAAAPPGRPATPWLQCPDRGNSARDTGLEAIWEAPDFVGGAPIDHYELRYRPQTVTDGVWQIGGEWQAWPHHSATTSTVISGLESDVLYGMQVRAVNANGPGQWSPAGTHRTGQLDEICDILDEFAPVSSGRDR